MYEYYFVSRICDLHQVNILVVHISTLVDISVRLYTKYPHFSWREKGETCFTDI